MKNNQSQKADAHARVIWDYMQMHMNIQKADAIFVLCSHDTRVADRAIELYMDGYAPHVIVSGGSGKLTADVFNEAEAEIFKNILIKSGVPKSNIIVEPNSTNTGENIRFTYQLLTDMKLYFDSFILVQKPYMERRTYATFKKQWPDLSTKITVTSPRLSYEEYLDSGALDRDLIINVMVGDLQRIVIYPERGFQIHQDVPDEVYAAYQKLVKLGYTSHLLK